MWRPSSFNGLLSFLFVIAHPAVAWVRVGPQPSTSTSRVAGHVVRAWSTTASSSDVPFGTDVPLMKATTVTTAAATTAATTSTLLNHHENVDKLQGKLLKQMRETCLDYQMLEEGDHIMVCVSGGKDSAVMLYLLRMLQEKLPVHFQLTAVHVDQHQPGYDGRPLVTWLDELHVPFDVVSEDTYSIVMEKTPENKSFCTVCSRLRRGILYSKAMELGCNKIALGHHADDAMETLLLNMLHAGQMKAMPARYTSKRGSLAVLRPLIMSMEADIERYAMMKGFPILPCNLCSNQANLQRPQVKLLLHTLGGMNPNAKQNLLRAMSDIRPSHLLDQNLREACGMDPITGDDDDHDDDAELR